VQLHTTSKGHAVPRKQLVSNAAQAALQAQAIVSGTGDNFPAVGRWLAVAIPHHFEGHRPARSAASSDCGVQRVEKAAIAGEGGSG
jgi:hypothetical protein